MPSQPEGATCLGYGDLEGKCRNPAGCAHTPLWCWSCNQVRMATVSTRMREIAQPEGASDKVLAIHNSDTAMSRPPRMTDHEVDEWIDEWRDWIVDASNEIEALRAKVEDLEAAANHDDLHCIKERARQDARIRELEQQLSVREKHYQAACAREERLRTQIRADHAYAASVGGGPCVCDTCRGDDAG